MLFEHVAIAGLAHVDAPHSLSSADINLRLKPTMDRLGIRTDVLGDVAGIRSRRLWDVGVEASDVATLAAEKAIADAGIDRKQIGLLVNTSVSRDYLEPSTASIVSGNLGLSEHCQNFDVANACLAFMNGMDIASRMIERGEIDYALIVDGETVFLAQIGECVDVSLTSSAKTPGVADGDAAERPRRVNQALHKGPRGGLRGLFGEGTDQQVTEAHFRKDALLMTRAAEQPRCLLRPQNT